MCEKTLETYWYVANESRLHVQKSSPGPRDKPENNRIKVSSSIHIKAAACRYRDLTLWTESWSSASWTGLNRDLTRACNKIGCQKIDNSISLVSVSTFSHFLSLLFPPGFVDSGDLPAHRNPRGHRAAGRPHVLQHLPGQQEPHQPNHGQGHAHTDAQRHLCTHGEPSSMFNRLKTSACNTECCLCRQTHESEREGNSSLEPFSGEIWH